MLTPNQGGETLKIGKTYRLVRLRKQLKDPYTGESLGRTLDVGVVEIKSRTDRTSSQLISGLLKKEMCLNNLLIRPMKVKFGLLKSLDREKYLTIEEKSNTDKGGSDDNFARYYFLCYGCTFNCFWFCKRCD